jgi:hypothetical protein
VAAVADVLQHGGRADERECSGIGQDQVNAGDQHLPGAEGIVERHRRGWQQGGVDIHPRRTRAEQLCEKVVDGELVAAAAAVVTGGASGAVEVAQEKRGVLHVECMDEVKEGAVEGGALRGQRVQRGVNG